MRIIESLYALQLLVLLKAEPLCNGNIFSLSVESQDEGDATPATSADDVPRT